MKGSILVALVILMSACATSYQDAGFSGGYSETRLDENIYSVSFKGNGFTDVERAADFVLMRCAELTMESGYSYFVVVDAKEDASYSTYTTPTTTNTTANVYGSGNYAYGSATSQTYGGQSYVIKKPSSRNTIVMLKQRPEEGFAYKAEFVFSSIADKYGVSRE